MCAEMEFKIKLLINIRFAAVQCCFVSGWSTIFIFTVNISRSCAFRLPMKEFRGNWTKQQSKALCPEDLTVRDQPNTEAVRGIHQNQTVSIYTFWTACSGDGFDRTPVPIQTNPIHRSLFQSAASARGPLHKRSIAYSIGLLHPIDYFRPVPDDALQSFQKLRGDCNIVLTVFSMAEHFSRIFWAEAEVREFWNLIIVDSRCSFFVVLAVGNFMRTSRMVILKSRWSAINYWEWTGQQCWRDCSSFFFWSRRKYWQGAALQFRRIHGELSIAKKRSPDLGTILQKHLFNYCESKRERVKFSDNCFQISAAVIDRRNMIMEKM